MLPLRRDTDLIVRELADETLVYDRERHKAHCLNPPAALVWRHCDGRTTLAEMAAILHAELGLPPDNGVVQLALDRLERCHLLQKLPAAGTDEARASRRDLMRKLGVAAVALPVVMTIFAPAASAAASGTTSLLCATCIGMGLPCTDVMGTTCVPKGQSGSCHCK
jgi:hypothetical protein